ncbi:cupin domain-containing protein [Massilia solisilvae]|uniref:Cupin domain-containing protein n=1 Tax=Massilia solisilvae TaxID=1811225 RepID=A0ABT2BLG0_9BURK|nr:cupin domain-containing protein [Massilia solisilvae]MCS0609358.1 cupin domain-containing protein [Massilia solisilvae]
MHANEGDTIPPVALCGFTPRVAISQVVTPAPSWLVVADLDRLVSTMDVQVIALSECVVGPGFALDLDGLDTPSFHYIRQGHGWLYTSNEQPAEIGSQTLIIVPPHCPFRFELGPARPSAPGSAKLSRDRDRTETTAFMLCGIFRSLYGNSTDLFDTLRVPIVEQFSKDDGLELKLQLALTELISRQVCADVLASTTIKQVIVALIRRSVLSLQDWTRRFAALSVAGSPRAQVNSEKDNTK